jgi:hypothetical protein
MTIEKSFTVRITMGSEVDTPAVMDAILQAAKKFGSVEVEDDETGTCYFEEVAPVMPDSAGPCNNCGVETDSLDDNGLCPDCFRAKLWKRTPWGWTTLFAGQRCSVRWMRAGDGSRVFVPRVNDLGLVSPPRAYQSLKAAQAAAEEFAEKWRRMPADSK